MNQFAYEYALDNLRRGHQIMIFVHSRKETATTIRAILDMAAKHGTLDSFQAETDTSARTGGRIQPHQDQDIARHATLKLYDRVGKSRNRDVQEFIDHACGIHHAGMLRSDRNLTEELFEAGLVRVLCCTATLAWGVNLPAHSVLIKGTQIYNAEKGMMTPLSMLDVMQIFGRAGRPQYDTSGEATMITTVAELHSYVRALSNEIPIESALIKTLPDHLNAEIVSGTVTNMAEALTWLGYSYLYVRMKRNPIAYGMPYDACVHDPMLVQKRMALLNDAATRLESCLMIRFDKRYDEPPCMQTTYGEILIVLFRDGCLYMKVVNDDSVYRYLYIYMSCCDVSRFSSD
jgi:activating signal cointegrator complex subunit 3